MEWLVLSIFKKTSIHSTQPSFDRQSAIEQIKELATAPEWSLKLKYQNNVNAKIFKENHSSSKYLYGCNGKTGNDIQC